MTDVRDFVELHAEELEVDESQTFTCPVCGRDGKFSVTRTSTGALYNCFRDSCDTRGHVSAHGLATRRSRGKPREKQRVLRPFTGRYRKMNSLESARFRMNNGLHPEEMERAEWRYAPDDDAFVFPVLNPLGYRIGVMLRKYSGTFRAGQKALAFPEVDAPWLSWHFPAERGDTFAPLERVIVVEDHVSAVKLSRWCPSIALLGTACSPSAANQIAGMMPKGVTIALDEDAVNSAYRLKRWYGLLLGNVDIVHLKKDVKDMSTSAVRELFGL